MKAMILCAGEGTRMAPLTDQRAKPALTVLDQTLVGRLVADLAAQGVDGVVVNSHAHPETLRAALDGAPIPVELSHEPELLGRGGGIRAARTLLADSDPFLLLNGDMCLDLRIGELLETHAAHQATVTLGLRDDARKGSFGSIGYDRDQLVCRITDRFVVKPDNGDGLFIGVHVLDQTIFEQMPERREFDILLDVYLPMLRRGEPIATWLQPERDAWWPVGSPAELLDVNRKALARSCAERGDAQARLIGEGAHVAGAVEGPVWVGAGARIEAGARVGPGSVIGAGASVPPGADLERVLLLPGAQPPALELREAIAYDREVWCDG